MHSNVLRYLAVDYAVDVNNDTITAMLIKMMVLSNERIILHKIRTH